MRLQVLICCLLAASGLMSLATTAVAQQTTDNVKAAETSGTAAAEQTLDKSALPRASKDFKSQTKILDGYISSGGIIERIEGDTIYLLSGDRFKVLQGIPVIPHYRGENRTRTVLGTDVLARGMAISYTLRDGRLEQVFIAGIVDEPFGNATVYDKIKTLGLQKGSVNTTGIDPRYSIRIKGKDGEVEIKAGETRLIQLAEPVMVIEWRAAEFKPEGVEDIEPFDYLLVEYRENGRIAFTCYATPTDPKADQGALPCCAPGQVNGRDALESLRAEFAHARQDWLTKVQQATGDEERATLLRANPAPLFVPRFLQLARDHAAEPIALDAVQWLCENAEPGPALDEGLAVIARHHFSDARVGDLCRRLGQHYSPQVEQFLSTVAEKHADRYTRGIALLCLGHFHSNLHDTAVSARNNPQFLAWARTNVQQTELDWILAADPEKCAARVDAVCKQIQEEYGDLVNKTASERTGRNVLLADSAKALQFSLHAVGSVAPEFVGKSGTGADLRLSDFQGKVVLLMFSANWCGPCKAMYGQLRELMRLYADNPFTVMTVMADQEASSVSAAVTSGEITWPAIWDGENGPIATAWNVTGYPTIYLIDRDNRIVKKDLRDDALDDEVATLLGIDPAARVRPDKRTRVWSLSLRDKKISGEELPELLDGYTELRELDLSDNPIADEALLHLVPLKNLQTLRLEHTGISDAGLRHLKELRSLKRLHLDTAPGHKTSEPGRRELRKSLPGLQTYLITH